MNTQLSRQSGFTLIEMLVSLSLFTIVATIVVGSLLVLVGGNDRLQGRQQVMSALSVALDSMTREIRTGTYYVCRTNSAFGDIHTMNDTLQASCTSSGGNASPGNGLAFREATRRITATAPNDRIAFYFDSNARTIMRRVSNNSSESIIPSHIEVTAARFYVTGTTPLSAPGADTEQPTVTIIIEARDRNQGASADTFTIQTTITQRVLDL